MSDRIFNEKHLRWKISGDKEIEKIIKRKIREVKRTALCLYFWLAVSISCFVFYFKTTGMILVRYVKQYLYSILKVVKEKFYDVIYLNNFLPYSYFLELKKICGHSLKWGPETGTLRPRTLELGPWHPRLQNWVPGIWDLQSWDSESWEQDPENWTCDTDS